MINLRISFVILLILNQACPFKDHEECNPYDSKGSLKKANSKTISVKYSDIKGYEEGESVQLEYKLNKDNNLIIMGDMMVEKIEDKSSKINHYIGRQLWPSDENGIINIAYYFEETYPSERKQHMQFGASHWSEKTSGLINFFEINSNEVSLYKNKIKVIDGDGCYASVGMAKNENTVSLGVGCDGSSAVHELGHSLGYHHEQTRADRDEFVSILWCNIQEGHQGNFRKISVSSQVYGKYDYNSIMHYSSHAFSTLTITPTILSKTKTPVGIIAPQVLSETDIDTTFCVYAKDQQACDRLIPKI